MGQLERQTENRKSTKRDRAKEGRARRASATATVNLRDVDWRAIAALNIAFAEQGGAIRIGYTRDGGALAVGCYLGDDYATEYIRPNEDFAGALIEIAEAWLPEQAIAFHQLLQEFWRQDPPMR